MFAHLNAMKARIEAAGFTTYLLDATGTTTWPYALILPGYSRPGDLPVAGDAGVIDEDLRVTSVALGTESLSIVRAGVFAALSPGKQTTRLPVSGRRASLRFVRTEFTAVDRDVNHNGAHPLFTVETFHLLSAPA